MSETLYGLCIGIPEQKKIVDAACFGWCGKVLIGGTSDPVFGPMFLCREKACPCLDKEMDKPLGEAFGYALVVRKLKPTQEPKAKPLPKRCGEPF